MVLASIAIAACAALSPLVGPAGAVIVPATTIAGPSAAVLSVGNAALATDGTGGVVWVQLSDGVPHIFASQFIEGQWSAPIQVDAGQPGPATFPTVAAGDGGELLVLWVQPWASESVGGTTPTTHYQLMSAVMEPGSQSFGPAQQVDPVDVGDGTGVYPSVAMAPDGIAYAVYRVVTNPLTPGVTQPLGTITPMRPGDELIDVRVARFNGLTWTSLGDANVFPGQVTMRKPTATNAPQIAVDRNGDAIAVWQEPTIDGVARIWARRVFGATLGNAIEVSPETINGQPVTVDADAPAVAISDYAEAKFAFRLQGGAGSPLVTPHVLVNTLLSEFETSNGNVTGPAVSIGGGATIGPPSVSIDDNGGFNAGFTINGQTEIVTGTEKSADAPQPVGPSSGDPGLATLDPDGGGAAVWPGTNPAGQSVVQVRDTFPDGGWQTASVAASLSGPISSLSIGPSGEGDALVAFQQGLSATSQVAVAYVQVPPHQFLTLTPIGWVTPGNAVISWDAAANVIGSVRYSVLVDGQVKASGLTGLSYLLPARGLGDGVHDVQVLATDGAGQETMSPVAQISVDVTPPFVSLRRLRDDRVMVRVRDLYSGPNAHRTVIDFGDGTRPARGRLKVVHQYAHSGLDRITVHCADNAGNSAVHRLWVYAR